MVMARYSLDNKHFNLKSITEKYEQEMNFIITNNYHAVDSSTFLKGIELIGQVQMLYNMMPYYDRKKHI